MMRSQALKVAIALLCLVGLNAFRYSDDQILERLYDLEAMQRIKPLFEDDPRFTSQGEEVHPITVDDILPYFPEADDDELSQNEPGYYRENNMHVRDSDFLVRDAEARPDDAHDPEQAEQSALWGTHYVSGGAGEGLQHLKPNGEERNKQEVKSDAALPAYCSPPNPCPKGYTEKDSCMLGVVDNAAYNRKYILEQQRSGYCACDGEHMKHCPKNQPKINTKSGDKAADVQNMLSGKDFDSEEKRLHSRVAKKSPRIIKRFKRFTSESMMNPYLAGEKIRTNAKKSPPDQKWNKWYHVDQLEGANDWA